MAWYWASRPGGAHHVEGETGMLRSPGMGDGCGDRVCAQRSWVSGRSPRGGGVGLKEKKGEMS